MIYFKEKKISPPEGPFSKCFDTETKKERNAPKSREMPFSEKQSHFSFSNPNYMMHSNFPKFCPNHWTLMFSIQMLGVHKKKIQAITCILYNFRKVQTTVCSTKKKKFKNKIQNLPRSVSHLQTTRPRALVSSVSLYGSSGSVM
jgi:hypothetical protein